MTRTAVARVLASALGLACLSAAPAVAQEPAAPPATGGAGPEAQIAQVTAPVLLDGEVLFRVRGTTSYPAEERARQISGRIEEIARTPSIAPEAVRAVPVDDGSSSTRWPGARSPCRVSSRSGRSRPTASSGWP